MTIQEMMDYISAHDPSPWELRQINLYARDVEKLGTAFYRDATITEMYNRKFEEYG